MNPIANEPQSAAMPAVSGARFRVPNGWAACGSQAERKVAARPCTRSCGFEASETIPFSGADSIFSGRCGAISGQLQLRNSIILAARQPESRTVSRARVPHLVVRGFRAHTISRRGFNPFKLFAAPFPGDSLSCHQPLAPATETPRSKRSTIRSAISDAGARTNIERLRSSGKESVERLGSNGQLRFEVLSRRDPGDRNASVQKLRRRFATETSPGGLLSQLSSIAADAIRRSARSRRLNSISVMFVSARRRAMNRTVTPI